MADGAPGSLVWRAGIGGADEAKADLQSLGAAGAAAIEAMGSAADATTQRATAAQESVRALAAEAQQAGQRILAGLNAATITRNEVATARTAQTRATNTQVAVDQRTGSQADVNALVAPGLDGVAKSARESAAAMEEAFRAEEQLAARAQALQAVLDPLIAAEAKRNVALREARELLEAGAITEGVHAAAVARAEAAYETAARAVQKHGAAIGLNTMQVQEFGHVARSVVDSLAAGASPMQVLAFEGTRVVQALGGGPEGVGGSLKALGEIATKWAPVIAGAAVFAALTAAALGYAAAMKEAEAATTGFGRAAGATPEMVMRIADGARQAGEASAKAAREAEAALLQTGEVSVQALKPATDAVLAFSRATGQDAKTAAGALKGLFTDPANEAGQLNEKLGFLDQATLKYIRSLDEQGDKTRAQIVAAEALKSSLDGQVAHLDGLSGAIDRASRSWEHFTEWVGRAALASAGFDTRTRDQQISALQHRLQAQHKPGDILADGTILTDSDAQAAAQLRQLLAESTANQRGAQEAQRRQAQQQAQDRYDKLVPKDRQRQDLRDQRTAAKNDLAAGNISADQYAAETKAIDEEVAKLDKSKEHHDRHAEAIARDTASIEANTRGALASADAYLKSTGSGQEADARRAAAADAARKGMDLETRTRLQLGLVVAQGAEAGAKAAASLNDQTDARSRLDDAVARGQMTAAEADKELQREGQLRTLLALQVVAQRNGLQDLTSYIQAYHAALQRANDEDDRSAALKLRAASALRVAQLAQSAQLASLGPNDPRRAGVIAQGAVRDGVAAGKGPQEIQASAESAVAEDRAQRENDTATYLSQQTRELRQQLVTIQTQVALASVSAGQRALLMGDLQKRQELEEHNVDLTGEAAQQILAQARNEELLNQALGRAQAAYDDVRRLGEGLLDDTQTLFTNMDKGWSGVEDTALSALKEIESELFKLALINPWKNSLFGENLPTLSSVGGMGGFFSSMMGGGSGFQDPAHADPFLANLLSSLPGHANGTDDAPPGYAWVGERGPELAQIEAGAKIIPHPRAVAMAAASTAPASGGGSGGAVIVNDYRRNDAPPARVSRKPNGDTHVDLYPELRRGMRSYVQGGDYEQDMRGATSRLTRRGG